MNWNRTPARVNWAGVLGMVWAMLGGLPGPLAAAAVPSRVDPLREPPAGALGYPSRSPDMDVLPGFRQPPPGYGEVPFWWWTGDPLDRDRLLWQIEELHRMGISGVQVNYAHEDTPGWPTYAAQPEIFSEDWWAFWGFVAGECGKRNMGIGLSGYTLDWPNGRSLVSRTIYSDPEITGRELAVASRTRVTPERPLAADLPSEVVGIRAYPVRAGGIDPQGLPLEPVGGTRRVEWAPAEGEWEVWVFTAAPKSGTLDGLHPEAGRRVVEKFFQRFQDHAPGGSAKGLNYFFHDELQFGIGHHAWTGDFAEQFRARKGYDVFEALPALFAEAGPSTPKARLDFFDVRMQLLEERYFAPIFEWHWSRGLVYGCDQGGRGRDPLEFGDYFRSVRWYTAPGHDTPGGHADLIKGKVSSSIAHFYGRPRVWLEGYHSLGWGAAPERLMQATCENYLYGCNLLNLHGLYYSTHGSFWEWAPPCYHFRMPYWEHMGVFLKYFERLSYLLSQGTHQADVAVLYPVSPGQAGLGGSEATDSAFATGTRLFEAGRDFVFIDDESLSRARSREGRLEVAGAAYRALILPSLRAVRWETLRAADAFRRAGGRVIAVGALPEASDRAGREDPGLDAQVRDLFGVTASEARSGQAPAQGVAISRGLGVFLPDGKPRAADLEEALQSIARDVVGGPAVRAMHRRIGPRDVYFVLGAAAGSECTFRASGRVEAWDPWTGEVRPIAAAVPVPGGTRVRLPRGAPEAQVIVFSPGTVDPALVATDLEEVLQVSVEAGRPRVAGVAAREGRVTASVETGGRRVDLSGIAKAGEILALDGDWEFELRPTLDNRWGDFRLPVDPDATRIGAEARRFRYAEESAPDPGWERAVLDDAGWPVISGGFGVRFWKLGPLDAGKDSTDLEGELRKLVSVDPSVPRSMEGRPRAWEPYAFSWRWGREGDPGHQGYHGLKEKVTDDFLCLGRPKDGHNETVYAEEPGGTRYYLWTTAWVERRTRVRIRMGDWAPSAVFLRGEPVPPGTSIVTLEAGCNPLLLRYDRPGRGHFVLQSESAPTEPAAPRTPLAMRWHDLSGVIPFDVRPAEARPAGWYRFTAPPGLRGMRVPLGGPGRGPGPGSVRAWIDGRPATVREVGGARPPGVRTLVQVEPAVPCARACSVVLRVEQERGAYGGAAVPEPIRLDCGPGLVSAGDWSAGSVLENYSGGAWYRRDLVLDADRIRGEVRARLNLGDVVATAEVRINGQTAGVRVAPPWVVEVGPWLKPGTNRIEILVFNTLANHYLTVPTRYRGELKSGLLGPVRLQIQPETILE